MSSAKSKLLHKELTAEILGGFYAVYNELGYGFLEHRYSNALCLELGIRGLKVEREIPVEIQYRGQHVGLYRMDLVVERQVVVEVKSGAAIAEANCRQVFNYLRASKLRAALLLHFGPRPSFRRFVI